MRPIFALAVLGACAGSYRANTVVPVEDIDDPAARSAEVAAALDGYHASFRLLWNGKRIGDAVESFARAADAQGGYRFERSEHVAVRRGGKISNARTRVVIETDARLLARRVLVERWVGASKMSGEAVRLRDDGWQVTFGSAAARLVDGAAVPSTLVPLLVAAAGAAPGRAFSAPVLVEGAGLAVAHLTLDIGSDRRRAQALFETAAGPLRAEALLDERGEVVAAGARSGVSSERVPASAIDESFDPPEVVDSSAVAVAGDAFLPAAELKLRIHDVAVAPVRLPDLPMQKVEVTSSGDWNVDVARTAAPRDLAEVRALTHHVADSLEDDLTIAALAPEEARAAGRGDCTAHAVVLAADLGARGYPTRLVTGFLYQAGALRRHRWVLVQVAGNWLAVDPTLDEVPASPAHLALAIHGASFDELAFVDDVAFAGWDHARAERIR